MRFSTPLLITVFILLSGSTMEGQQSQNQEQTAFSAKDTEILEELFTTFKDCQDSSMSYLMVMLGRFFEESPYLAHTLEFEPEDLVVNLREFDCNTFAESCLAISRTIRSGKQNFEQFTTELKGIRYRNGIVDGYPSRIHYFSEWIYINNQKVIIRDVSREIGGTPFRKEINFMSTHPGSYQQLLSDTALLEIIARQEQEISERGMYFVPEKQIKDVESRLREGDIVGITTSIDGLDILHVGILVRKSDHFHLLHASSRGGKVILSEETLETYLANSKLATGIMIARPL